MENRTEEPSNRSGLVDGIESVSSFGETDVEQDAFSFLWTVKNYSTIIELGPPSSAEVQRTTSAELNKSEDSEDAIDILLVLIDRGNEDSQFAEIRAKYQLSIVGADGQPSVLIGGPKMEIIRFSNLNDQWGYFDFAAADLINRSPNLAVDDKLKILCKIWIYGDAKQTVMNFRGDKFNPSHEDRYRMSKDGIADDLGKLFRKSIATDVTILGNKTNFKAHKLILIARSPVFAAMFNSDMLENRSNSVQIADFEDEVVKGMLEHLYTGETDCMDEWAQDLLKIAEKYDLNGLKADCEFELGDKLDLENAGELLVLTQNHNAPDLKARVVDFIKGNKDELLKTKSFQDNIKLADAATLVDLYLSQM